LGHLYRSVRYVYSYFIFFKKKKDKLKIADHKKIISLLCPSRGRPENAIRFISSVYRTAAFSDRIEILFYIDSDDERKNDYSTLFENATKRFQKLKRCEIVVGEPISVSKSWNILAERCRGDFIAMANDDQVYVDYGWDVRLVEEAKRFPDQIFCFCFNDGSRASPYGAFPMVSRKWFETLGYFTPGIFIFAYTDIWIIEIARLVNRFYYLPDVLAEHLHCAFGKALMDSTYSRNRLEEVYGKANELLINTKAERRKDAEKLRQVIDNFREENG
jgi:glycosyl transferase/beta-hydroxylase protein BlmF